MNCPFSNAEGNSWREPIHARKGNSWRSALKALRISSYLFFTEYADKIGKALLLYRKPEDREAAKARYENRAHNYTGDSSRARSVLRKLCIAYVASVVFILVLVIGGDSFLTAGVAELNNGLVLPFFRG